MKKNKSAFSLLELSLVIVIISVVTVMITKGSVLINSARLSSARSLTIKSIVNQTDGLIAWYETSQFKSIPGAQAIEGEQITTWNDTSPSSQLIQKNVLTKSSTNNVTFAFEGINNLPSLRFGGAEGIYLNSFYQGSSAQNTIFIVFKPLNIQALSIFLDSGDASKKSQVGIKSSAVNFVDNSSNQDVAVSPFNTQLTYVAAIYLDRANSRVYLNNAMISSSNITFNSSLNGLTIGSDRNATGGAGFNGLISEVIIFNRPLQTQERRDVMGYLAKKYKISVTGINQ